ncbi:MAG: hypothetical protein KAI83_15420, partial [Thiomargarita sp.]|nr:hypothetical protein [Thiomargarita sp.]
MKNTLFKRIIAIIKKIYGLTTRTLFVGLTLFISGVKNTPQIIVRLFIIGLILFSLTLMFIPIILRKIPWFISRIMNWVFVIGFIAIGLILSGTDFFEIGLVFIVTGILIFPYINDFFKKISRFNYSLMNKTIIVLLAFVIVIFLFNKETEEKQFFVGFLIQNVLIDYNNERELKKLESYLYGEESGKKKESYENQKVSFISDLQFWYENGYYQDVINQGNPYVNFDPQIGEWIKKANVAIREEKIKTALEKVPQLMKEKKYREAYKIAEPLQDNAELKKHAVKAKKIIDKDIVQLRKSFEKGRYKDVIKKGTPYVDSSCLVQKLVSHAEKAKAKVEERERFNKAIKKIKQLIRAGKYDEAIEFAQKSQYATDVKVQDLIKQAKSKRFKEMLRKTKNLIRAHKFDEAIEFAQKSQYATDVKVLELIEQAKSKRFKDMLRKTEKLIRAHKFDEAIEFAKKSLYATDVKVLKLIEQAKSKRFKDMLRKTEKLIRARQFDEAIEFVLKSRYATEPKALKLIEQAKSKRFKEMLRETEKLIKARQFDEAIEFVQKSLYATEPKALKLIEVAQRKRFDGELFKANKLIKTYQFDKAIELIKKT